MQTKQKEQRFMLRARVIGKGVFACPYCGRTATFSLTPTTRWRVQCAYENCRAVFRVGLVFYRSPPSQGGRPSDIHPDPIPQAEFSARSYRRGMRVHQVKDPEGKRGGPVATPG